LEAQLESEHEERTQLLREKHELERRLGALEEAGRANRATDEDQLHRLRKDLRRTKALLRDAQTQLERSRGDSPGKALLRQLRNQVRMISVSFTWQRWHIILHCCGHVITDHSGLGANGAYFPYETLD
jgi:myosin-18